MEETLLDIPQSWVQCLSAGSVPWPFGVECGHCYVCKVAKKRLLNCQASWQDRLEGAPSLPGLQL